MKMKEEVTLLRRSKTTAAYKAAALIFQEGPMMPADLFSQVDFGVAADIRNGTLRRAVEAGWLELCPDGSITTTQAAHDLVATEARIEGKYIGQRATSRDINLMARPAYVPPRRMRRNDEPKWSERPDGFSLVTIA
jgi:hypothetical protein